MQYITLFRFVEVLLDAPYGATISFSTDLPGNRLTVRSSVNIPGTNGRHPYRLELSGNCKGKLYSLSVVPQAFQGVHCALYGARVYARPLSPQVVPWAWYPVPGIAETSPDWTAMKLPIPATSDEWSQLELPVKPTPPVPEWVSLPVDE